MIRKCATATIFSSFHALNATRCNRKALSRAMASGLHSLKLAKEIDSDKKKMMAMWPDVIRNVTETDIQPQIPEVSKRLSRLMEYMVPDGKKTRALALLHSYKMLAPSSQLTEDNIRLAIILGWGLEMLHPFLLVHDDIMDNAETRLGNTCWHRLDNIGLSAINDAVLLEQATFLLLKNHFRNEDCYPSILETFHEHILKASIGSCLDFVATQYEQKPDLDLFTMERYKTLNEYKIANYLYLMPVTLAMHLAGIKDPELYRQARRVLVAIGHLHQEQDDFLDVYGDPEVMKKSIGNDIPGGKLSWLIVTALKRADPDQRKILEECYGLDDPEKISRVKQVYDDLDLVSAFSIHKEETYNRINTHIKEISPDLPQDLFSQFLNSVYRGQIVDI